METDLTTNVKHSCSLDEKLVGMKALQQCLPVIEYKIKETVYKVLMRDHSNKSYETILKVIFSFSGRNF